MEGRRGDDAFTDAWLESWDDWSVQFNEIREGDPGQVVVDCTQRGVDRTAGCQSRCASLSCGR